MVLVVELAKRESVSTGRDGLRSADFRDSYANAFHWVVNDLFVRAVHFDFARLTFSEEVELLVVVEVEYL